MFLASIRVLEEIYKMALESQNWTLGRDEIKDLNMPLILIPKIPNCES
jgi:hypothetical protein